MSDPIDEQDFVREADAFRAALTREADAFEATKVSVPEPPVRRRWNVILAAAAAVALVAGLGGVVAAVQGGGSTGSTSSSSDSGAAPKAAAPEGLTDSQKRTGLSVPPDGMRWAVRYDIAFQVPKDWIDAPPPVKPECITKPGGTWDDAPRKPYVATDVSHRMVPSIACPSTVDPATPPEFGKLAFSLWQPYVDVQIVGKTRPTQDRVGSWSYRGWNLDRLEVEGKMVSILTGPHDGNLRYDIKRTLMQTPVDLHDCDTASPVAPGGPIQPSNPTGSPLTGAVTSISICQYNPTIGYITGSRELTGSAAQDLADAIRSAPVGPGPGGTGDCLKGIPADTYVALRLYGEHPGTVDVAYDVCSTAGFYDGRTVRRLTADACRPIFARDPITITSSTAEVMKVCARQ